METDNTVEMTESSGVTTQGADTSSSAAEASPTSQNNNGNVLSETQSPEEQMIAKTEYDKRVANLRAEYERKNQKFQEQYKGAQALERWVQSDPKRHQYMMKLLNGEINPFQEQAPQQDPYAEFDPLVAEQFRKMDQLTQWQQKMEQMIQQSEQQAVSEAQETAQSFYEKKLLDDGFVGKDGNLVNPEFGQMIHHAVRSALTEIAQDPNRPTTQEMEKAYKTATAGLEYAKRMGLKGAVVPKIPQSGSRSGMPSAVRAPMTEMDRINYIGNLI